MSINGVTGICLTKLDVMDSLEEIKICTAYEVNGKIVETFPVDADSIEQCKPVYMSMPGWQSPTVGVTRLEDLPVNAINYIAKIEELLETPIDIISTGPERNQNVIRRHPFD